MVDEDRWLEPWLNTVRERSGAAPVLELGCGNGRDTAALVTAGVQVVAVDRSARAIEMARAAVGNAQFHIADIRDPFPLANARVVVASLSLHYFTWAETAHIVVRIKNVLRDRGLLICRLNSTRDHHYGASGYPRIEDDYYLVNGRPKRFFDRRAVERLFEEWRILSLEERMIHRYARPKVVWEAAVETRRPV
jgi:SAM-dependent methyltransferase